MHVQECHEEIVDRDGYSVPCEKPAVGYRIDLNTTGKPYPVCKRHLRAPIFTPTYFAVLDDFDEREDIAQEVVAPPCTEFHWLGQTLASCDMCGKPYWVHETYRGARIVDAAAVKRKWGNRV